MTRQKKDPRRASRSAGFTLVELLVVLAIFSLMSVLLFQSFQFATHASISGNARLARARDVALASSFLRRQLADIRPLPVSPHGDGHDVAFTGSPDGVDFVGTLPAYLSTGGFQRLRIAHSGESLTVQWRPVRGGEQAPDEAPPASVLLDGIGTADFAYFGSTASGDLPEWHPTWSGAAGLPQLVRLRITFRDGYAPPELIIAPRPMEPAFQ